VSKLFLRRVFSLGKELSPPSHTSVFFNEKNGCFLLKRAKKEKKKERKSLIITQLIPLFRFFLSQSALPTPPVAIG
jgi:hypothetical protein